MKQQLFLITLSWFTIAGAVEPDDIFEAAQNNDTELVQQCIDRYGAEALEIRGMLFGNTPLHEAAYNNAEETVQLMLGKGGLKLLEIKNDGGNTPLHSAASWSVQETIQLLLDLNANIHAINSNGEKPIELTGLKQLFTQHQLKLNQQLLSGTQENNPESAIQALNGGAEINTRDGNDRTALHHATLQGNLPFIKGLLGQDADPTVYDSKGYGELAIHIAAGEPRRLVPFIELHDGGGYCRVCLLP